MICSKIMEEYVYIYIKLYTSLYSYIASLICFSKPRHSDSALWLCY